MRSSKIGVLLLSVVVLMGLVVAPSALAEEQPQYGGVLRVAIAGDPPSLDMHQESTFKVLIPMSTVYNTLTRYDPHGFPKIIGDLAKTWERSNDGLSWTFTLHQGVKFHDGSALTSADIKASWEKIIWPSKDKGVVSTRRSYYAMVKSIETPDRDTVVFRLNYPSASFLSFTAHPANLMYAKKNLDQDANWYKRNANGTGPFKFKQWVRGSFLEVERNPNYFRTGMPYLDGAKYFMIKDLSARAKSVRSGRTDVEFRGFPPAEVEAIQKQLGDTVTVRYPKSIIHWGVAFNADAKPFDDVRVRQAMSLAIDREDMAKVLGPLTGLETIGGIMHPDTPWALDAEELHTMPGFAKDHQANLTEAKRLLAEAGYPNGFKTVLMNRAVKLPYIDFGVYLISKWKKIGVDAKHKLLESATWSKDRRTRNFSVMVDPMGSSMDGDPDQMMVRWLTGATGNHGKFSDPEIDRLFELQKVELDRQKRIALVKGISRVVMGKSYWIPGLWWTRIEVRSAKIKNYEPHHSHWMNRRLEDVWMAQK